MRIQMRRHLGLMLAMTLLPACMELQVENLNEPDRQRALANQGDLITLIGSAFGTYYGAIHSNNARVDLFMNYGTEFTSTTTTGAFVYTGVEPRVVLDNAPAISVIGPQGPRSLWEQLLTAASIPYDFLTTLGEFGGELKNTGGQDITPMATAYAKLIQGMAWGYLAVMYDQAPVLTEDIPIAADTRQQMVEILRPAPGTLEAALASLDDAKAIAQQNTFVYPTYPADRLWFGSMDPITNEDIVRIANTLAARFLVLNARTPEERAQVDWQRVLQYTAGGVTRDFGTTLDSGFRSSSVFGRASTTGNRWDNRLIGQADISGAYQAWIAAPIAERNRFDIVTPDRRITGPTPTSDGSYTRYLSHNNGFDAAFGLYFFSAYQWRRHQHENGVGPNSTGSNTGTARLVTVDENNLLRAEALIYTGDLQGAAELINITRTRPQLLPDGVEYPGLPPVTADGVPESADCVPRTDAGACGDLMVALRYERMIELAGLDMLRGYADSRGFGLLPDHSFTQLPIPGDAADMVGVQWYSFGGIGGQSSAVYAPVTMANVP